MRIFILAALAAFAIPALADPVPDLILSLDSTFGSGSLTNLNASADPPCLQPNCVLFIGSITNTDIDPYNNNPVYLTGIDLSLVSGLSIDNTFFDTVPGTLSGDPTYATDGSGAGPVSYYGPVFGIDIAPWTAPGVYGETVTISGFGGANDPGDSGFTITQDITVTVSAPEPVSASLFLAGLAAFFGAGVRRKWLFTSVSR